MRKSVACLFAVGLPALALLAFFIQARSRDSSRGDSPPNAASAGDGCRSGREIGREGPTGNLPRSIQTGRYFDRMQPDAHRRG